MQYQGGKARIAKHIVKAMGPIEPGKYMEPFCGACNVAAAVGVGGMVLSDQDPDLIAMWDAVMSGWEPPSSVTRDEYYAAKRFGEPHLKGFISYGCSYAGKRWGGYAVSGDRNYARQARNAVKKIAAGISGSLMVAGSFEGCDPGAGSTVYCDPPYAGTTQSYFGDFDSERFWAVAREWARGGCRVFVSEYQAPGFAEEIWRKQVKTTLRIDAGQDRTERLFRVHG